MFASTFGSGVYNFLDIARELKHLAGGVGTVDRPPNTRAKINAAFFIKESSGIVTYSIVRSARFGSLMHSFGVRRAPHSRAWRFSGLTAPANLKHRSNLVIDAILAAICMAGRMCSNCRVRRRFCTLQRRLAGPTVQCRLKPPKARQLPDSDPILPAMLHPIKSALFPYTQLRSSVCTVVARQGLKRALYQLTLCLRLHW
jgi:hypothetical protein